MKTEITNLENAIELLKDTIQDCNVNFLLGSGMSAPCLPVLGNVEKFLNELAIRTDIVDDIEKIIRSSLYKKFFDSIISKNIGILQNTSNYPDIENTLNNYKNFLKTINSVLLNRKNTILSKQVNIFTTNIDIFLEKALDSTDIEYNDGFNGRFKPLFNLTNFKKLFYRTSLHYDNKFELPVFNIIKLHGSLTWKKADDENIYFSSSLKRIKNIQSIKIPDKNLITIKDNMSFDELASKAENKKPDESINEFISEYEKLAIINPTKGKFKETVLDRNYYELLRIYSNELEKENTVLFVAGFSFSDEHVREITIRVANSNPTLKIYIFSYSENPDTRIQNIEEETIHNNIKILTPTDKTIKYNLNTINCNIFNKLLKSKEN